MALADSMPGVSGGTVAFIMGFYDQFIGSIYRFVFGGMNEKESFRQVEKGILFFALGCLLVVVITWLNGHIGTQSMDLSYFSIGIGIKLFLIGMMAGSFYAIVMGSTTLANAQPAMGIGSFRILVALTGIGLVLGMQKPREKNEVVVRARA